MTPAQSDLLRRLAIALDACLDHLDRAAAREAQRETAGGPRVLTDRQRALDAHTAVTEAFALLGIAR